MTFLYNFTVSIYNCTALSYNLFEAVSLVRGNLRRRIESFFTKSLPKVDQHIIDHLKVDHDELKPLSTRRRRSKTKKKKYENHTTKVGSS